MSIRRASLLGMIWASLTSLALGSEAIPNWPAPASWSPPRSSDVRALGDITNPLPFIGVTPCRVADTRGNGFTGQYGPPSLAANATRSFTITGQCGIPATAAAVSFNFAALNVGAAGDLRVFPAGGGVPLVSTLNYNANTPNIANAAVVPLGTGGAITVQADAVSIDLIIDVNGYYYGGSASLATGETFTLVGDVAGQSTGVLSVHNTESVLDQVRAGYFLADSSGFGSVAIAAYESAGSGLTSGVYGQASSSTSFSAGIIGAEIATAGQVYGLSGSSSSSSLNAAGVLGTADSTTGSVYGVKGVTSSTAGGAVGVYGVQGSGSGYTLAPQILAGVFGDTSSPAGVGVFGSSKNYIGVIGQSIPSTGLGLLSAGYLGYANAAGVYFVNGLAGTGTKSFVEPHPTDASKVIRYVSLEGPEAGTYFRGRGRFQQGIATIELPDSFRMVTDPESLSIQVTPIGEIAGVAVVRIGIDGIVVKASRDVEFFYTVNGVRRAYNNWDPIQENERFFVPESPEAKLPIYLSEEERGRLIANGTYNPDGTVNMETAERLGWTKMWAEREVGAKARP